MFTCVSVKNRKSPISKACPIWLGHVATLILSYLVDKRTDVMWRSIWTFWQFLMTSKSIFKHHQMTTTSSELVYWTIPSDSLCAWWWCSTRSHCSPCSPCSGQPSSVIIVILFTKLSICCLSFRFNSDLVCFMILTQRGILRLNRVENTRVKRVRSPCESCK